MLDGIRYRKPSPTDGSHTYLSFATTVRIIGGHAISEQIDVSGRFSGDPVSVVIHGSEICLLDLDVPLHVWALRRITFIQR